VVKLDDAFFCPGYKIVEDRRIRCARTTGHGAETFETGIMNSCNPVFMELGERLGAENFVGYFKQFGLLSKTNIDLPGEAGTIMHKTENIGPVELATISFGQSFQITPIQLVTTVSSIINGGTRVTPHFGVSVQDADGNTAKTFSYETHENICTAETSETWNSENSTLWLKDASYIRLKTLTIGYTFTNKRFLKAIGAKSLGLSLNGYNLLTFSPLDILDPESLGNNVGAYPLVKVYSVGVNLNF